MFSVGLNETGAEAGASAARQRVEEEEAAEEVGLFRPLSQQLHR